MTPPRVLFPAYVVVHPDYDGHEDHYVHYHPAHAGAEMCSCGTLIGVHSTVPPTEPVDYGDCARCARDRRHARARLADVLTQTVARRATRGRQQ